MASGMKLDDQVIPFFTDMKSGKNDARLATFMIDGSVIKLEKSFTQVDLDEKGQDGFEAFKGQLTPSECKYILYDCHFATKESSTKEELVFVMWCPDVATVKEKMKHAASKDAIKRPLTGIKHDFQINDLADCQERAQFAEFLLKNTPQITQIEGVPLCDNA